MEDFTECLCDSFNENYQKFKPSDQQILQSWIDRLTTTTNEEDSSTQNAYAKYLIHIMKKGTLHYPFLTPPPCAGTKLLPLEEYFLLCDKNKSPPCPQTPCSDNNSSADPFYTASAQSQFYNVSSLSPPSTSQGIFSRNRQQSPKLAGFQCFETPPTSPCAQNQKSVQASPQYSQWAMNQGCLPSTPQSNSSCYRNYQSTSCEPPLAYPSSAFYSPQSPSQTLGANCEPPRQQCSPSIRASPAEQFPCPYPQSSIRGQSLPSQCSPQAVPQPMNITDSSSSRESVHENYSSTSVLDSTPFARERKHHKGLDDGKAHDRKKSLNTAFLEVPSKGTENSCKINNIIESINCDTILKDFVYQVAPFTRDKGKAMEYVIQTEILNFRNLVEKILESRKKDVGDGLASEQVSISDRYDIAIKQKQAAVKSIKEAILKILPDFDFHTYEEEGEVYLQTLLDKQTRRMSIRQPPEKLLNEAIMRMELLIDEAERLEAKNEMLKASLAEIECLLNQMSSEDCSDYQGGIDELEMKIMEERMKMSENLQTLSRLSEEERKRKCQKKSYY